MFKILDTKFVLNLGPNFTEWGFHKFGTIPIMIHQEGSTSTPEKSKVKIFFVR